MGTLALNTFQRRKAEALRRGRLIAPTADYVDEQNHPTIRRARFIAAIAD
ncbi:MAG: hypothetical protein ACJ788_09785 [Ktedonobacteraceae bacterium]